MKTASVSSPMNSASPQVRQQLGGNDPEREEQLLDARLAGIRLGAEAVGEGDDAGDDERDRDDRGPPDRIGVPERDHGAADAGALPPGLADGPPDGAALPDGEGVGTSGTSSRIDE